MRVAQVAACGFVHVNEAHGLAIDDVNPVCGHIHSGTEAAQVELRVPLVRDVLADAAITEKESVGRETRLAADAVLALAARRCGPCELSRGTEAAGRAARGGLASPLRPAWCWDIPSGFAQRSSPEGLVEPCDGPPTSHVSRCRIRLPEKLRRDG